MDCAQFLGGCPIEARRRRLWEIFQEGCRWLEGFEEPFTEIVDVTCHPTKNEWRAGGHILLVVDDEEGRILHELFHSKYDPSVLHDGGSDEKWGDAFCDAFRYFASQKINLGDRWLAKIDEFSRCDFHQVMERSGDPAHDKKYGYPASRIIAAVGSDWRRFPPYWNSICGRKRDENQSILNQIFSYDIDAGMPTSD